LKKKKEKIDRVFDYVGFNIKFIPKDKVTLEFGIIIGLSLVTFDIVGK